MGGQARLLEGTIGNGQVSGGRYTVEAELIVCSRETAWVTKKTGPVCHV